MQSFQHSNKLVVLMLAEYFVENNPQSSGVYNAVTDQPWQSSLGFRRVIPENNRNDNNWTLGSNLLKDKPSDTPLFKHVRYVPAPVAD